MCKLSKVAEILFVHIVIFKITFSLVLIYGILYFIGIINIDVIPLLIAFILFSIQFDYKTYSEHKRRKTLLKILLEEIYFIKGDLSNLEQLLAQKGFPQWTPHNIDYNFYQKNLGEKVFSVETDHLIIKIREIGRELELINREILLILQYLVLKNKSPNQLIRGKNTIAKGVYDDLLKNKDAILPKLRRLGEEIIIIRDRNYRKLLEFTTLSDTLNSLN